MSLVEFPRNMLFLLIRATIAILWAVDEVTNFSFKKALRISQYFFIAVVYVLAITFLIYSINTKYLSDVIYEKYFAVYIPVVKNPAIQYPRLVKKEETPKITAKSALVADGAKVLYEKEDSLKLPPASTAKLITALVALDIYKLDETVVVSKDCTEIDSTKILLPEKAIFKVKDLLYAMLIGSAGDAACVLATSKVPYEKFVILMNEKAKQIGMNDTQLSNPIGLDGLNGENHSTAMDLYKLSLAVMNNNVIRDVVGSKKFLLSSEDKKFSTFVYTTNVLLWEMPQAVGIKTGTTEEAGQVLVFDYADKEKDLKIIVMGSTDRFSDTKELLRWVLESYSWKKISI